MVFTITLSSPQRGDSLIEVIRASMQEFNGEEWKYEEKRWMEYQRYHIASRTNMDGSLDCMAFTSSRAPDNLSNFWEGGHEADGFKRDIFSPQRSFALSRKNTRREVHINNDCNLVVEIVANVFFGGLPLIVAKYTSGVAFQSSLEDFISHDFVFTFIDPNLEYNELLFYANLSSRFTEPGGAVESYESEHYKALGFNIPELETRIQQKLPQKYR